MTSVDTTAGRLDPVVVRALAGARTPKFLATRDATGIPNVVPVLSLEAADDETVIFAEMMIWKTRRNLEVDPRVSIMVLAPDLRTWTVRGRFVEFQSVGPHFDHVRSGENFRYNAYGGVRSAGVIRVEGVTRTFKLSQVGVLLDGARSRLVARSLGRDGAAGETMPVQVRDKFGRLQAAKALAFLDDDGHPDCLPALSLMPAGSTRLVFGGATAKDVAPLIPGLPIAAAVLSLEPVAYQVKGEFAGLRSSLRWDVGVIDVREAYSASPPLPGKRL
jgi:hypothetical protein